MSTKSTLTINPHPDEVDDVRWVKPFELIEMFDDSSLLFSPGRWNDLERTMTTDDFCDFESLHRFDPPPEHLGGAGDAQPMFDMK